MFRACVTLPRGFGVCFCESPVSACIRYTWCIRKGNRLLPHMHGKCFCMGRIHALGRLLMHAMPPVRRWEKVGEHVSGTFRYCSELVALEPWRSRGF